MASPFKNLSQIKLLAEYQKLSKQAIAKLDENGTKVLYFPKFEFTGKTGPLILFGDPPTPLVMAVKKEAGSNGLLGSCSMDLGGRLVIDGQVTPAMVRSALSVVGVQKKVASASGEEEAPEETPGPSKVLENEGIKPTGKLPVWPPPAKPVAPPKPPVPRPQSKAVPPVSPPKVPPPVVPKAKPPPAPKSAPVPPPPKQEIPPAPPKPPSEKEVFTRKMQGIFPLFQKACNVPEAPDAELQQLYRQAGELALAKKFAEATAALEKLHAIVTETLGKVKAPSGKDQALEPAITEGAFVKSRQAWRQALRDANAAISALQAAILSTKDPRAANLASGFGRILTKLPNPTAELENLSVAAEKGDREAVGKHKTEVLRLARDCTKYLGTDRLVTLAVENPFIPVKLNDFFKGAFQSLHAELN